MPAETIDRKCHWLRKNRSTKRPEWLLFVDAESHLDRDGPDRQTHRFRLGWACLCQYVPGQGLLDRGWYKILDPLDLWHTVSALAVDHHQIYVVSHNIEYDARVLHAFSILPNIGWTPDYLILSESCHFFTFKAGKDKISLLDNTNYWRVPLATLGKSFGITKQSVDFDSCTDSELSEYCKRDVDILVHAWRYWLDFIDEHDLGDWGITLSSQSWNAYRHRWMPHKIGIHNRLDALTLERTSYKGGRCEVWRLGTFAGQKFYKLDINGLYAYCMEAFAAPQKLVKVIVNVSPSYLKTLLKTYLIVADVLLDTDLPVYAIRLDGFNVFPVGSFRTCLTTRELSFALDHGHIKAIGQVALYTPKLLFRPFIRYFTPLRQEYKEKGDKARSLLCKMIRNSLYGKFAQRGYKQETIADAPLDKVHVTRWIDGPTGDRCIDWTFGGKTLRQYYTGEGKDSMPAIASHIAAAGRMALWNYATLAGLDHVYYADTDSLIVDSAGYQNLTPWLDPVELGYLKVEGVATDLQIIAKKSYVFGKDRTLKGIKRDAKQVSERRWKQTHFTSLKWAFASGNLNDVQTYDVTKEEHATLYHGRVSKDGTVLPHEITLDIDQVSAIVAPESEYLWDWWIDVPWYQTLYSRKRDQPLPQWYLRALGDPEAVAQDPAGYVLPLTF